MRSRRTAAATYLFVVILALAVFAACQPSGPTAAPTTDANLPASASPAALPSESAGPGPGGSPAAITVDPSLLSILPREVDGALIVPAPEAATEISVDPSLATDVEALAVALAVAPAASNASAGEDLVIANVIRLRTDVFSDEFFRNWRDTYDAAACEPAGGLGGNAEAEIDGRQVFIGSCANGGFTYHLRYGEDVIVSLTSVGDRRLGEQLVKNLGK